jgi:leader peptidase (prepilin peptidase)/N-methyltransferase
VLTILELRRYTTASEMQHVFQKTLIRTSRFLGDALTWRKSHRQYAPAAWALIGGAVWLMANPDMGAIWPIVMLAALYLLGLLAGVCAIDARYGIIPNSFVAALALGGVVETILTGQAELLQRVIEALLFFLAAHLFRTAYRLVRGHDGLGFGDVKFATAGVLWVGIEAVPGLLLIAVLSALISLIILRAEGQRLGGKQAISFGPHLAIALWLAWIAGPLQFTF